MNKKVKKALTFVSLSILLTTLYKYDKAINVPSIVEEADDCYTYSKGKVYIGSREYLLSIFNDVGPNDILVYDGRNGKDPNMKIISSYRIKDSKTREEILKILMLYEKKHPSNWKRTIKSMRREWLVHNILYNLEYETKRTKYVDLNNKDEELYRVRRTK